MIFSDVNLSLIFLIRKLCMKKTKYKIEHSKLNIVRLTIKQWFSHGVELHGS